MFVIMNKRKFYLIIFSLISFILPFIGKLYTHFYDQLVSLGLVKADVIFGIFSLFLLLVFGIVLSLMYSRDDLFKGLLGFIPNIFYWVSFGIIEGPSEGFLFIYFIVFGVPLIIILFVTSLISRYLRAH